MKFKVENSQRYENRMRASELKLSSEAILYKEEEAKEASIVTLDYTNVYINDLKEFGNLLLLLTNLKSNDISVLDFETIRDTNILRVFVEFNQEEAMKFAKRLLSNVNTREHIEIVEVEQIEMFELDLGCKDIQERFIKINR